jgi:hypothetical protein
VADDTVVSAGAGDLPVRHQCEQRGVEPLGPECAGLTRLAAAERTTDTNVVIVLITSAAYAKGDWKRTRLTSPDDGLAGQIATEVIAEEGH